jgi:signal transduction histidine kinase
MAQSSSKSAKTAAFMIGLGLLLATALVDYVTGYQVTVLLFYLVPILFVLKRVGQAAAYVMSFLSGASLLLTDMAAGETYTDILTPAWNTGIRIWIFLLVISLVSGRRELERLVRQRTEKLEEEIKERLRLEKELLAASEREQQRIGHDLHDSLGQHLTATALAGKVLFRKLAGKALPEKDAADQLVRMVEDGIELTRTLARSLHPMELEAAGLINTLQDLAANISRAFNVSCRFECPQPVALTDLADNLHIYRIVQESVSNAIRHGHAQNIVVRLEPADNEATLTITDDGAGLPEGARSKNGMGLRIMNYRADMIGATFDIARLPAGGTRVSCSLPLNGTILEDHEK